MSRWIRNFAYHTRIGPEVFIASGAAALGIALMAISVQVYRAAAANCKCQGLFHQPGRPPAERIAGTPDLTRP